MLLKLYHHQKSLSKSKINIPSMELEIKTTNVFSKNMKAYEDGYRFLVNQGGSRSSKTFSILQLLIFLCLTTPKLKVSIVRKSFPSLIIQQTVLFGICLEIMEHIQ